MGSKKTGKLVFGFFDPTTGILHFRGPPGGGPLCQFQLRHLKKGVKKTGGVKKSGDRYTLVRLIVVDFEY